jgi:predicted component of viral defense system (DUF524 family)
MDQSVKKHRTSQKAVSKYKENNYDRVELSMPKGKRDIIKKHAAIYQDEVGEIRTIGYTPKGSMNAFINRAINETMERDKAAKAGELKNE